MNSNVECLVIGSGPSGVSAAMALLQKGCRVKMIDVGLTLEAERKNLLDKISIQPVSQWDKSEILKLKGDMPSDSTGVQVKMLYGSDYPYREATEQNQLSIPDASYKPSHAQGGLSTVWGGSILPFNDRDFERWPIRANDMAPHYRAVTEWMPVMATEDDLLSLYPLHGDSNQPTRPSRQTKYLLDKMARSRAKLRKAGVIFGQSRAAMSSNSCQSCGLCLYGCPYKLIYNSADTLLKLLDNPDFKYISGVRVDKIQETSSGVALSGVESHSNQSWSTIGDRVFVGAGIIPTARIVLDSAEYYNHTLPILDSQYTLLPLATTSTFPDIESEALHTLCQLYLEIDDPQLSRHNIHCQLYTYSDLFKVAFQNSCKGLLQYLPFAHRQILSRLMIAICYLHSDDSSQLNLILDRPGVDLQRRMQIDFKINPRTSRIEKSLAWKLFRYSRSLGIVPIVPMIHLANPGRGYHNGGSFPMSLNPNGPQTDILGRPFGWNRIHLIDASVFPTIPAATITYTVMANAHRIASNALQS